MKKLLVVLSVVALAFPVAVRADSKELAGELMTLMKVDETMKQGMEMSRKAMLMQTQQMAGQMGGQANLDKIKAHQDKVMDLIESEMSWDKMKAQFVELYASIFTESELKGLIEFYRSPVGQTFIRKQPELMQKSMELNQRMMMNLQPKLMQLMQEAAAKQAPSAP